MNNIFIRLIVIVLALFGVYKMFPQVSRIVDYYVKNPSFQSNAVLPAINTANKILPDKIQIPAPAVMGVSVEASMSSPLKELTDQVTKQATDLATEQIKVIRKVAADQFCQVLIEKIKTECNQQ